MKRYGYNPTAAQGGFHVGARVQLRSHPSDMVGEILDGPKTLQEVYAASGHGLVDPTIADKPCWNISWDYGSCFVIKVGWYEASRLEPES